MSAEEQQGPPEIEVLIRVAMLSTGAIAVDVQTKGGAKTSDLVGMLEVAKHQILHGESGGERRPGKPRLAIARGPVPRA